MDEVELKILDINRNRIEEELDRFAEKEAENILLTTITFSNPYNKVALRARLIGGKAFFTVKTPVHDKEFKARKELETAIGNIEVFKAQLEMLGFKPAMLQEKKRTTYRHEGTEIVIDQYPGMPAYLEIEGKRETIKDIVERLGYRMDQTTTASVYEIFRKYGIDAANLVFSPA